MTADCITCAEPARIEQPALPRFLGRAQQSRPVQLIGRLLAAWRRRQRIAGTVRTLSRLDRRTLEDIGVPPERIRQLAAGLDRTTHGV